MGHTLTCAKRMNLAAMTPQNRLASSTYCLANPGHEYLIYLPDGGEVTVDLMAAKGTMTVEWIHPVEGTIMPGEPVSGGSRVVFRAPFPGSAVLYLKAQ